MVDGASRVAVKLEQATYKVGAGLLLALLSFLEGPTSLPNEERRMNPIPARRTTFNPRLAAAGRALTACVIAVMWGCEVVDDKSSAKQDTTTAPAVVPESARGTLSTDSTVSAPVTPAESLRAGVVDDTGMVRIYPPEPRRGGVVFAFAEGIATPSPRCTWKSAPVPCYLVEHPRGRLLFDTGMTQRFRDRVASSPARAAA